MKQRFESSTRSQILLFSGCSADGYTGLFWKQVFAGSNPATQTNFLKSRISNLRFPCRRGLKGKGAGLRNQFMRVRISPSVLTFRVGDVTRQHRSPANFS